MCVVLSEWVCGPLLQQREETGVESEQADEETEAETRPHVTRVPTVGTRGLGSSASFSDQPPAWPLLTSPPPRWCHSEATLPRELWAHGWK